MAPVSTQPIEGKPVLVPHLKRVLNLRDLVIYGIVLIQPIAVVPLFGVAQQLSLGHTVTTLLVSMVAIMLTAVSYGRMAALYPAAGSAYTYVGRSMNPHLGFMAGWAMFLGYLMLPLINVIYVAVTVRREFPHIPYAVAAAGFAFLITSLNLLGIRWTARANQLLLTSMCIVIGIFILLALRYVVAHQGVAGLFTFKPFYNPKTFRLRTLATATSFAALTYIGFDGVTTLAEDVENPRRNILLALVLTVLFTGLFSGLLAYLAQLVWPDFRTFTSPETAFMDVCKRAGGIMLYHATWVMLITAAFGSSFTGQVGAARILFGMGRDNVLPRRIFAYLDPRRNTPIFSIALVGILAFAASFVLNFEHGSEILNSGALIAFMGVNAAVIWEFYVRGRDGRVKNAFQDLLAPLLGFASCLAIWLSLPRQALLSGGAWLIAGLAIAAYKTRGFTERPIMIDFSE
jgi:putrescine importer